MSAREAKEEKNIFNYFFWKNAVMPQKEAESFIRWAELGEWTDSRGRELNSQKKVLAWASGWEIRNGVSRTPAEFISFWNYLYALLLSENNPIASSLIDTRITAEIHNTSIVLAIPEEIHNWIETSIAPLEPSDPKRALFDAFRAGKKLLYQPFIL